MLYFIFELISIVAYLFNGKTGMIITSGIFVYIFFSKKYTLLEKILISLLISLPLFNIGIAGMQMNHMFSWVNIFLAMLMLYLGIHIQKEAIKFQKKSLNVVFSVIIITFVHCFFEVNIVDAIIEWCQLLLMLIPIFLIYAARESVVENIKLNEKIFNVLNGVLLATSIAVMVQAVLYYKFGILVGEWTFFEGRTKIDLLFTGSSVLSMFLGIGIPLNLINFFDKNKLKYLLFVVILIIGIIINSARTGLVAGLLVSVPLILKNLKYKRNLLIMIVIAPIIIVSLIYGINYMLKSRGTTNLLEENGRNETYTNAINSIMESPQVFIFGNGLSLDNYGKMMPHNLFLETWLTMGVINLVLILGMFMSFFKMVKITKYKFLAWEIIVGGMFITNFTGNTFATLIFILLILQAEIEKRKMYE